MSATDSGPFDRSLHSERPDDRSRKHFLKRERCNDERRIHYWGRTEYIRQVVR
jgi:hypothetical protein